MEEQNKFDYTYTAPTQAERKQVEAIRARYIAEEPAAEGDQDKLARLRALDEKVRRFPTVLALTLGILGTLIFGGGMAMVLEGGWIFLGGLVSIVGLVPLIFAYPAYRATLKRQKKKYADEIVSIADDILK